MDKKRNFELAAPGSSRDTPSAALDSPSLPAGEAAPVSPAQDKLQAVAKPCRLGRVVLRREKAHRGGKTVIVIHDFAPNISSRYIETLADTLKAACGCGGTTRERIIEIQGDQPGRIRTLLEQEGFRV